MLTTDLAAITDLESYVTAFGPKVNEAARIALNDVAEGEGLTLLRADVNKEINFPAGYLTNDRLGVTKRAKVNDLSATITGRQRPTSLARFIKNPGFALGRRGVELKVKRSGSSTKLENAFLVKLRQGTRSTSDGFNVGLAVRLKPGEVLRNSKGAVQLDKGLYLLYGPSVDQVFREVAPEDAPNLLQLVERQFFRQFQRLVK